MDEIRYWWENDYLIVNFTITNRQNFTIGVDSVAPWIKVDVWELNYTGEWSGGRRSMAYATNGSETVWNYFTLYIEASRPEPWQQRYYEREVREELDLPIWHQSFGPMHYPPNASLSPEVVFKPTYHYRGWEGHYYIHIHILSDYPYHWGGDTSGWTDYYSGCFNLDTPEYYGWNKTTGANCRSHCLEESYVWQVYGQLHPDGYADHPSLDECVATSATPTWIPPIQDR